MVRLNRTYYSLLKFTSKIFKNCLPQLNSSELRKFHAIRPHSLRIPQNSHYSINLLYIMFQALALAENPAEFQRITQIPCNSPTQSANYAKFAVLLTYSILCFRHLPRQRTLRNSSELHKFRAIRPHHPRITRNSHHLLTLHLTFQMPDHGRELLKIPANQAKFAQFAHISRELREFHAFCSKLIHI